MTVQFFKTPKGEEFAILPREDYEALVSASSEDAEDAVDLEMYRARKEELDAGRDARLPPEVAAFMLNGDSLLRALRKWKDITQLHLHHRTNLGQGYLSDLKSGRRKGTKETWDAIAKALEVDPALFDHKPTE